MLVSKRLGMPNAALQTHAGVLASMRYTIKTIYGVSESFIQSTPEAVLLVQAKAVGCPQLFG
jgi:hypothetical protein